MASFFKSIFSYKIILAILSISASTSLLLAYLSPYIHPEKIKIISLFGLGYPIIIIANLALLLLLIILKSKWALLVGLVIISGGNLHFRTFTIGSGDEKNNETSLKVLSYNTHLFGLYHSIDGKSTVVKDKIFDFIKDVNPDIACFQEYYHQDNSPLFSTKDSLLSLPGVVDYNEFFFENKWQHKKYGIFMYSKYPIIESGNITFEEGRNNFNYCIYSDIVVKQDTLRIYNTHLQSIKIQPDDYTFFEEESELSKNDKSNSKRLIKTITRAFPIRANQAKVITSHIRNSPYPVIVCGDFNDTPMSYCYNLFNAQLTDAYRNCRTGIGKTYAGSIPAGRIDYIFHSPSLGSNNFEIQAEKLSDHYSINCEVFIK